MRNVGQTKEVKMQYCTQTVQALKADKNTGTVLCLVGGYCLDVKRSNTDKCVKSPDAMFEAACAGDIYVTPYDLEDDPVQILLACRANKKLPL